ncbi:MAG: orotidine 5'-phosphate decarboxylase [Candidatus Aenigmarchaeota archaeon]|nr:orotidine 5'-phosphate decarboxylase [Candidatus Aenigmarchaeota archaeon]
MLDFELHYGVIPACDVSDVLESSRLVEKTKGIQGIVGYKIGFNLGARYSLTGLFTGLDYIPSCDKLFNKLFIYDHQKAGTDIPQMGADFAELMQDSSMHAAIIFPLAGPETEEAFIKALLAKDILPIVGGEMTHPKFLAKDGGFIRDDAPEDMYRIGWEAGARHFVVPGNKPDAIAKYSKLLPVEAAFLMPGIGRQGGDIASAFEAAGARDGRRTYAIIGSGIYGAADQREAAKRFSDEALKFL